MKRPASWDQRDEAHYLRRRMTIAEHAIWRRLRGKGLGVTFRRRRIVCGMIPSFSSIKVRLAVHVVGPDDSLDWATSTKERFQIAGVTLLVFLEADVVARTDWCIEQIRSAIPKEPASNRTPDRQTPPGRGFQAERRRVQRLRESFRAMQSHRLESQNERES